MTDSFWKKIAKTAPALSSAAAHSVSRKTRIITWVTLLFQLLFPLSLALTPIMTTTYASPLTASSEPYIIGPGETLHSVAKQHQLSLEQLQQLNAWRTFAKPFAALGVGDEIDVPRRKSPFSVDHAQPLTSDTLLAQGAQSAGQLLSNDNSAKAAVNMARSAALSQANSATQQWLSQFGTARLQLNTNDHFHLDGSELDLLLPLVDAPSSLLFTQLGARNKDSRNTINIGAGVRVFHNHWMYGANTFFDNDLTGKNRRFGVGAEAWTDYLKLSANGYFRLTDWHQSRDFANHNERPANGYDIRAEAYLPAYPQLGGKLMFEQYRGEEVALFGKDERQKNPRAITAGLNYTPVPLVTLGAEHRVGSNGKNNSRINFQLNYRLGESWQSHINPSAVAASRTLAGSRYDLVERNNHIVLDYQKQDLIRLTLPDSITHYAGNTTALTAEVTTKHGLSHIDWDSSALVAAGGTVTQTAPHILAVTLPPYQHSPSRNINNTHILSAVAHDSRGNVSNRAVTQIIVTAQSASEGHSQTQALPEILPADGLSTSQIIVRLRDGNNQSIAGAVSQLILPFSFVADAKQQQRQLAPSAAPHLGEVTEILPGEYQALLTAGTEAGRVTITPMFGGNTLGVTPVTVLLKDSSSDLSPAVSSLEATPQAIIANGSDHSQVKLTLRDSNQSLVSGQSVTFDSSLPGTTVGSVTDQNDGTYTAELSGTQAGQASITAQINGSAFAVAATTVTLTADDNTATIVESNFTAASGAVANGSASNGLTAKVQDANSNALANIAVTFAVIAGEATPASQTVKTNAEGVAKASLVSKVVGDNQVTAQVGTHTTAAQSSHFVADDSTATIAEGDFTAASGAVANGTASNGLMAKVQDANGNPVADIAVTFAVIAGQATPKLQTVKTNAGGVATTSLVSKVAGDNQVTAQVGTHTTAAQSSHFVADDSTSTIAEGDFTAASGAVANGTTGNLLTAKVQDANGNPVADIEVTFAVTDGQATPKLQTVKTNAGGVATASLVSKVADDNQVTAQVGKYTTAAKNSRFVADARTAKISKLVVVSNEAKADGSATNSVQVTVTDANDNYLADQKVAFEADNGATIAPNGITDINGTVTMALTNTTAGNSAVTTSINDSSQTVTTVFVVDTVADLTLSLNSAKAKIGDTVTMVVTAKNSVGSPVSGAAISLAVSNMQNRQGVAVDSGILLFNGAIDSVFTTESDGNVTLAVTDPHGTGVSRDITATADAATATENIIFTIITSPDTRLATMWGHMADTVNGFSRPKLHAEVPGDSSTTEYHEIWGLYNYASAIEGVCGSEVNLPSKDKLAALYLAYPNNAMHMVHGWPISDFYRSSTPYSDDYYYSVNLNNGMIYYGGGAQYVSCI